MQIDRKFCKVGNGHRATQNMTVISVSYETKFVGLGVCPRLPRKYEPMKAP